MNKRLDELDAQVALALRHNQGSVLLSTKQSASMAAVIRAVGKIVEHRRHNAFVSLTLVEAALEVYRKFEEWK